MNRRIEKKQKRFDSKQKGKKGPEKKDKSPQKISGESEKEENKKRKVGVWGLIKYVRLKILLIQQFKIYC